MDIPNRPFSSGSRQAPDPYDQFLEREGFYRKHTARDSTCLFRVVSEQIFDVQLYHEKVRTDCVNFMREQRHMYEKRINGNFDDYIIEMNKTRTYGSFTELNALAHTYRCNVLLFEPYNCGTWFVNCESYDNALMVFFSPDKHFDSIFSTAYIKQAAYCQALVYEILYVKVFKLPDVMYSVERMLHDPEGRRMIVVERKDRSGEISEDRIITTEGRQFVLSTSDETECVLDNYRLCHFHNKENFASIVDIYRSKKNDKEMKEIRYTRTNNGKVQLSKELNIVNPMLCDRKMSCVRQLLREGITPFPYKVAKALDPSIYRNIEFDSWSDTRRELKYRNWYFGGNNLQVGVKCLVNLSENDLSYCYIQDMKPDNGPCLVYIEDTAECRTVPYEKLQPLPHEQIRPWMMSYKSRKPSGFHHMKISTDSHPKKKIYSKMIDVGLSEIKSLDNEANEFCCDSGKTLHCTLSSFTGISEFQPAPAEMIVMPFIIEDTKNKKSASTKNDPMKNEKLESKTNQADLDSTDCSSGVYDMFTSSSNTSNNQSVCYSFSEPFSYDPTIPSTFYAPSYPSHAYAFATQGAMPCPYYAPPNPMMNSIVAPHLNAPNIKYNDGFPNFHANHSVISNGSDLPLHDLVTLRYFYNLGVEYFRQNQLRLQPPILVNSAYTDPNVATADSSPEDDANEFKQLMNDFESGLNIGFKRNDSESGTQQKTRQASTAVKNDNNLSTKRKLTCSSKPSKKINESKSGRFKPVTTESDPPQPTQKSSKTHVPHHVVSNVGSDSGHEIMQPIPYGFPVYPPSTGYPVGLPLYAMDSSSIDPAVASQGTCYLPTYMVPPYGAVIAPTPPSDIMMVQENLSTAPQPGASEAVNSYGFNTGYPPMIYTAPHPPPGYTVFGYPQQHALYSVGNNSNNNNSNGECTDNSGQ
ncbi:protein ovarian tumor locus-like isoform X2 [Toxorhynchites rutilus septentrionalis]|uniref:protein ovarian tumor locus-like isoform X2 n=1 Tax=Toxorhynchites rutilus septentrionalis TaxID=329112 RepID=UPI00247ADFBE|nr:protein ovarian tumor locus-like isoform X2 [Toxorhynchites rutilus septentrionalis]